MNSGHVFVFSDFSRAVKVSGDGVGAMAFTMTSLKSLLGLTVSSGMVTSSSGFKYFPRLTTEELNGQRPNSREPPIKLSAEINLYNFLNRVGNYLLSTPVILLSL